MVTDQIALTSGPQEWDPRFVTRSPMFAPLIGTVSRLLRRGWPDPTSLNALLDALGNTVTNANGERIRFVTQVGKPTCFEEEFEPRTYLRGEVMVRPDDWHDLFNALVWMTFPLTKAAINARHFALLQARVGGQRSPAGDALTLFDEDGVVVLSANERLLELLRRFRWRELFWDARQAVSAQMRFMIFGHAMYDKARRPFVGMTAKSILLHVSGDMLELQGAALNDAVDQCLAAYIREPHNLTRGRSLSPLPVLGIPGWWPRNETGDFYDDASYFRPGRGGGEPSESSSTS